MMDKSERYDLYSDGFLAGLQAGRKAADHLAIQLHEANVRADEAWRRAHAAQADAAEQRLIAVAAQEALVRATTAGRSLTSTENRLR